MPAFVRRLIQAKLYYNNLTRNIFFILLVCAFPLKGQNMISLYKQYIPAPVLENKEYTMMVAANLEAKAKIHPDLIYYNIESLRKQMLGKDKQEIASAKKTTSQKEAFYISKRNQWAIKQRMGVYLIAENQEMKERTGEYFRPMIYDSLAAEPAEAVPAEIDQNLMDYFVIKYMRKDSVLVYDASADYHKIRTEMFIGIVKNFDDMYKMVNDSIESADEKICEKMLQYWYVYSDLISSPDKMREYHLPYQIIYKVIGRNFITANNSKFLISAGYCLNNSLTTLSNSYPVTYTKYSSYSSQIDAIPDLTNDILLNTKQIAVSLGYKVYLRKYFGILSYVNIQLGASFSIDKFEKDNASQSNIKYKMPDYDIYEAKSFAKNYTTINSVNSYMMKLSVPLVFVWRSLYLEGAVNAGVVQVKGAIDYKYYMTRIEGFITGSFFNPTYYTHLITEGSGEGTIDINKNYFTFFPSLEVVYETGWGFQLRSTLWSKYIAVTLGYSF